MLCRFSLLIACFCFLAYQTEPQQPPPQEATKQPAQPTAAAQSETFPASLRKSVAFISVTYLKDGQSQHISGTCFFVFYEDKRLGEGRGFAYVVTNRHMAVPGSEAGASYPVQQASVRLNLRNPDGTTASELTTIPLATGLRWIVPLDDAVDLAVLPGVPDQTRYEFVTVPVSVFTTQDEIKEQHVDAGDNVVFAGFFYQFPGLKKIQPIIREGMLAMMPDEELETTLRKPGHLYLADIHVLHGNSGSPVFVNLGGFRNGLVVASYNYRLLGIVSGYFVEDENFKLTVATTLEGTTQGNSGISMIVPAFELRALLDSPVLQQQRDAVVAAFERTKKQPGPDH